MNLEEDIPIIDGIHQYGFDLNINIWSQILNRSVYVDNRLEGQCVIFSKPIEQLRGDLEGNKKLIEIKN